MAKYDPVIQKASQTSRAKMSRSPQHKPHPMEMMAFFCLFLLHKKTIRATNVMMPSPVPAQIIQVVNRVWHLVANPCPRRESPVRNVKTMAP